jgi:hypothetical protein
VVAALQPVKTAAPSAKTLAADKALSARDLLFFMVIVAP